MIISIGFIIKRKARSIRRQAFRAGGGGFILFYVPITKKKDFLNSFKKHQIVQFEFSDNGSKIIYNSEKYEKKSFYH